MFCSAQSSCIRIRYYWINFLNMDEENKVETPAEETPVETPEEKTEETQ